MIYLAFFKCYFKSFCATTLIYIIYINTFLCISLHLNVRDQQTIWCSNVCDFNLIFKKLHKVCNNKPRQAKIFVIRQSLSLSLYVCE